jgi:hypothetical protein
LQVECKGATRHSFHLKISGAGFAGVAHRIDSP